MNRKKILSGIQPTGHLHLGRYFGAVENWVKLQSEYDSIYCVVDYHAITMPYNPIKLKENVWELIYNLLACGIHAENLFIQSKVPEHTELAWILGCMCSYGELSRMTQFKDKSEQIKDKSKDSFVSSGIFTYPVLQAADILIYKADFVPVGKDQDQHLELTRNIAQKFNSVVGKEYFKAPEGMYSSTSKIMSTADPTKKMSASMGDKHNINVFAPIDQIRKQIRSAVTDAGERSDRLSPGVENLFMILKACNSIEEYNLLLNEYKNGTLQYGRFKDIIADAVIERVTPIQNNKAEILKNSKEVKESIKRSSAIIRERASQTISEVKALTGLG
ncbi:MAG: tryptophan--tRNA ligase [Saprospiraceae bacterium]|nr:tryptophan--tRNA ligase [Saprospiraceae bacterium]